MTGSDHVTWVCLCAMMALQVVPSLQVQQQQAGAPETAAPASPQQALPEPLMEKRAWSDLSSGWGKRGWHDLQGGWGKRAWSDLGSTWGKRGWDNFHGSWGKRAWDDLRPAWGKRGWDNFHGSWGKRTWPVAEEEGYDDEDDTIPLSDEQLAELAQLMLATHSEPPTSEVTAPLSEEEQKRSWSNLRGAWGKRAWSNFKGSWGKKREPGWNNLKGLWGKRSDKSWNKLASVWGKRSVDGETGIKEDSTSREN